jgi:nitrite reductase/ring-hydroxylating ferredoxin subunit
MEFTKVAQASTIATGSMCKADYDGQEILIANVAGTIYAIPDKCPHKGHSLVEGTIRDGISTCPGHGAQFDVKTGKAVHGAKVAFFQLKVKDTRSLQVKLENDDIVIASDGQAAV